MDLGAGLHGTVRSPVDQATHEPKPKRAHAKDHTQQFGEGAVQPQVGVGAIGV